jgi:hypothetical protein
MPQQHRPPPSAGASSKMALKVLIVIYFLALMNIIRVKGQNNLKCYYDLEGEFPKDVLCKCQKEMTNNPVSIKTRLKILPVLTREHYTSLLHWV